MFNAGVELMQQPPIEPHVHASASCSKQKPFTHLLVGFLRLILGSVVVKMSGTSGSFVNRVQMRKNRTSKSTILIRPEFFHRILATVVVRGGQSDPGPSGASPRLS